MSASWQNWFALGVLRFGLSPDAFWRLSVLEWRALCAALGPDAAPPPERGVLETLMRRFPDGVTDDRHV